jgi:hypothetical protein
MMSTSIPGVPARLDRRHAPDYNRLHVPRRRARDHLFRDSALVRNKRLAALALLIFLGCSGSDGPESPEGAVRLFIAAARGGDRSSVFLRLGPITRARIENLEGTIRPLSGRTHIKPEDFLSVGWAPPSWEPAGTRLLQRTRESAEVEVYSSTGDRHSLSLVREGREWKVELPGR